MTIKTLRDIPSEDREYAEFALEAVEATDDFVELRFDGGLVTGYRRTESNAPEFVPEAGQMVRFYGRHAGSLGGSRRGLVIDGTVIQYRTEEEDKAYHRLQRHKREVERQREFEENEEDLYARWDALPVPFRARLTYFVRHNPDFYWEFLPYELMVCEDAAKLALVASAHEDPSAWIEQFYKLDYERQREQVPQLSDGHSGNSFGFVVRLAHVHARGEMVELEHGALCPLVGCEAYGCRFADEEGEAS